MLLHFNVKPILVFDGCNLPSKAGQEERRRKYVPLAWISVKVCLIAENFFSEGVTLCLEGFIPLENRCVPHKGLYLML